jgi:aminoglycoside 6'-N-acetyltransferase
MSGSNVRLVDATQDDLGYVARWLCALHVSLWWGDAEDVYPELEASIAEPGHAMIEVDGRKVGFVVWAHPSREELDDAGLTDIPTEVVDLDMLIGEPDMLGKGIGWQTMRLAAERALSENPGAPFVIGATSDKNSAALGAALNAGFDVSRTFGEEDDRYVLAVYRRK